jgi:hypothetical protein
VSARRKHFQAAKARQVHFDTQHVWTFHLWQEFLDYAQYTLALSYSTYDLSQHLDGQPLQVSMQQLSVLPRESGSEKAYLHMAPIDQHFLHEIL